jgi:thymidylate synthase
MRNFDATTADLVWQKAATELIERPEHEPSGRSGATREFLPCVLRIRDPRQRWILSRRPPYNPAFGLVEFLWIITGHNESRVLNYWNPILPKYSGSGDVYHGAYGFRLKNEFGFDQIERAYHALTSAPESRQVVLQMWKPEIDFPAKDGQPVSTDIPCNVMSLLKLRNGRLSWSQIMRSNDIMLGLPYNFIQFTLLQEVMAGWLGVELGEYIHFSDSLHVYEKDLAKYSCVSTDSNGTDRNIFSMPYDKSNELFSLIYENLAEVSNGDMKENELGEIFDRDSSRNVSRCGLIKDMMVIIGSDAAHRQNFKVLARHLVNSCDDHGLKKASHAWLDYREGK